MTTILLLDFAIVLLVAIVYVWLVDLDDARRARARAARSAPVYVAPLPRATCIPTAVRAARPDTWGDSKERF
jgi:hypothetical protein